VRRTALAAGRSLLLAAPTALAFFSGGYFSEARAWAGLGIWVIVVGGLLVTERRWPTDHGSRLALGALTALAAWTLLSMLWAPIAGDAYAAAQIAVLYVGTLLAASLLTSGGRREVEPLLAGGVLIVVGYGLSERLLPGVLHFSRSVSAGGRLEQPLTYWNAMGETAALGVVLCVRLAGDQSRQAWLRMASIGACGPLGLGLYISFSRGALFACVVGLLTLVILVPRREQLVSVALAVGAAAVVSVVVSPWHGVTGMAGSTTTREREGALALAVLVVVGVLVAGAQLVAQRRGLDGPLRLPAQAPALGTALICLGLVLAIALGAHETSARSAPLSGGGARLVTLRSNRYDYWSVALRAFATEPLHGVGAGGWGVDWLRWRHVNEYVKDAHSLELQTLAELGVVGALLLLAVLVGVALAARHALGLESAAAGPVAALTVYLAHSPLDWDWQMPAVTMIALILAGSLFDFSSA
jgi:hypothetical protein